ncbi:MULTISPECIES: DUF1566 domain-containing protein [unclassified Marinimicrobium]|uniref:Lcl domain-containing protein n=1 Tax=unclassified Marinimicrobium TaxID=2632100 RepID=UPI002580C891|nr:MULTISPECIES: DUF1566 domain-containing protein [unclassified Marinimicrobium]
MRINLPFVLTAVLLLAACGGSENNVQNAVDDFNQEKEDNEPEIPPIDCSGQPDLSDAVITGLEMTYIQQNVLPATDDAPERHLISIYIGVEFNEPDDSQASRARGFWPEFSLFQRARATSCEPPELGERAVRLELTSDSDFNADYPAGTVLNDLLIDPPNIGPDGRAINSGLSGLWNIVLLELPTEELVHRFTVTVELDSGALHEITLDPLYFPANLPAEDNFPDDPVAPPGFSTSYLNDTGIETCGDNELFDYECPVAGFPLQDGEVGRDRLNDTDNQEEADDEPQKYDFTKIDSEGNELPDDATEWFCTRDNVTGLLWEVKTETGLHGANNLYSWYSPDDTVNGGVVGVPDGGHCEGSACDTHAFLEALNEKTLCGRDDWRLPDWGDWFSVTSFDPLPGDDLETFKYREVEHVEPAGWWTANTVANSDEHVWGLSAVHHGGDKTMYPLRADETLRAHAVSGHRGPEPLDVLDRDHCRHTAMNPTTPTSAFDIIEGGTVVHHTTTNLQWQRCSVGQHWDGSQCSDSAEVFTWQQALNQIHDHDGWRLPNIIELLSLYESCGSEPAINPEVFPATPGRSLQGALRRWGEVRYWSASQSGLLLFSGYESEDALGVNFGASGLYSEQPIRMDKAGDLGFVRLVRDVEP